MATAEAPGVQQVVGAHGDPDQGPSSEWINYAYRAAHPILRWLPSKLAEWIGDNYGAALSIPLRNDAAAWSVGELNAILENNIVPGTKGHLSTFGAIQWESELFDVIPFGSL